MMDRGMAGPAPKIFEPPKFPGRGRINKRVPSFQEHNSALKNGAITKGSSWLRLASHFR
jgi:hypothetical protein